MTDLILLGAYRAQLGKGGDPVPEPCVCRQLIDDGLLAGTVIDGKYYVHKDATITVRTDSDLNIWASTYYVELKKQAVRRSINFNLSKVDFWEILQRSNGHCELTGIKFDFSKHGDAFRRPWIPSMDRIDSSAGYEMGNCRLVCAAVNSALNEFGFDVLMKIATGLFFMRDLSRIG